MSKSFRYICRNCGYRSHKWFGRCPSCGNYDTLSESGEEVRKTKVFKLSFAKPERMKSGLEEWDRVLGGGLVKGSVVLLAGEPGIGKSTLMLQIADSLDANVLYVAGEETLEQVSMRAERIGASCRNVSFVNTNDLKEILEVSKSFDVVIVDSIQMLFNEDVSGIPGSVSQVRESTSRIVELAKKYNISFVLTGHITKSGDIAGPKVMEHTVDVVLYMEGDRRSDLRILRSYKNRFGSSEEVGILRMTERGLVPIEDKGKLFVSGMETKKPGIARSIIVEGRMPMVVEVQALVSRSFYANPMRNTTGYDLRRLNMLLAVLERFGRFKLRGYDIFLNVVGGIKVSDPSLDLAVLISIASSLRNKPIEPKALFVGEVGLTGDVLPASMMERRIKEAMHQGFELMYSNYRPSSEVGFKIVSVRDVGEVLHVCLG